MRIIKYAVLILLLAFAFIGPYAMFAGSFANWSKSSLPDLLTFRGATLDNYRLLLDRAAWLKFSNVSFSLPRWYRNSLFVATGTAVLQTLVSVMAGYALARYPIPAQGLVIAVLIAQNVIPASVLFIPMFVVFQALGVRGLWGMILPFGVSSGTILMTRQFGKGLAHDIFDAAQVDGANDWQMLRYIGLPMLAPMAGMTFASSFAGAWANLTWANALLQDPKDWIVVQGLLHWQQLLLSAADGKPMYGVVAAAAFLSALLPLGLFLLMRKQVDQGIQGLVEE